jgi:uncharacterized protein (DUF433 family)
MPVFRDNEDVARAITRDPETMHGVPVFRGSRVPVQTLFAYLEGGDTLEDFLEGFPTVPHALALALEGLEGAKQQAQPGGLRGRRRLRACPASRQAANRSPTPQQRVWRPAAGVDARPTSQEHAYS